VAGLGVAVGNASPEVKAVAGVIAPPLAEDGRHGHRALRARDRHMRFRLLACDIDETLVRFPAPPSAQVVTAIQDATRAGSP